MWQWRPFQELNEVDTIIAKISDHQSALIAEELKIVASAVPARIREFTAGRSLARNLLARRDLHPKSISAGPGGQPVWPANISGSISHTASLVGVAIGSRGMYRGIGLDIELAGKANEIDQSLLMTPGEIEFARDRSDADLATRLFSCKEAAFKAVFPIVGEAFEFVDVEVSFSDDEFRVEMTTTRPSSNVLATGRGLQLSDGDHLATIFYIAS